MWKEIMRQRKGTPERNPEKSKASWTMAKKCWNRGLMEYSEQLTRKESMGYKVCRLWRMSSYAKLGKSPGIHWFQFSPETIPRKSLWMGGSEWQILLAEQWVKNSSSSPFPHLPSSSNPVTCHSKQSESLYLSKGRCAIAPRPGPMTPGVILY